MSILREPEATGAKNEPSECKTLELGLDGFRECPYVGPISCAYAVPFGYGFLCKNAPGSARPPKAPANKQAQARTDSV